MTGVPCVTVPGFTMAVVVVSFVTVSVVEPEAGECVLSPLYAPVTVSVPNGSVEYVMLHVFAASVQVPMVMLPSVNFTVPVAAGLAVSVAV